jgi:Alcohol dehydrogenase GroES-associated/Alcohol dehydrogenase GroES-like domain
MKSLDNHRLHLTFLHRLAGRQEQLISLRFSHRRRKRRTSTMKALTWHGRGDIRRDSVSDPKIQDGRDAMGEVVEVGSENKALKVGDRVVISFTISRAESASSASAASIPAANDPTRTRSRPRSCGVIPPPLHQGRLEAVTPWPGS